MDRFDDLGGPDGPAGLDAADVTPIDTDQLALLHAGEFVVAAPHPGAPARRTRQRGETTEVHYWFPVQVEVVGLDDATAALVVARVFDELGRELEGQG